MACAYVLILACKRPDADTPALVRPATKCLVCRCSNLRTPALVWFGLEKIHLKPLCLASKWPLGCHVTPSIVERGEGLILGLVVALIVPQLFYKSTVQRSCRRLSVVYT